MKKTSLLQTFDITTRKSRVLHEFSGVIEAPNWLPDGDTMLFNADGRLFLYTISADTIAPLDTGSLTKCNNDHVVFADGSMVGFSCNPYEDQEWASDIFLMPLAGGTPRKVTRLSPSYLHGITHDGSEMTYCAFRDDKVDIYSIPTEGGDEKLLTDGAGFNDGPEYSPDGRHIWFNSTRAGLMQIYRMNRDGTGLCRMSDMDGNNWFPHLSLDGKRVVFLTFRTGDLEPWQHLPDLEVSLWLMDSDGKNCEKLIDLFGGQGTINVNSWAPDSKRFAFVSYQDR